MISVVTWAGVHALLIHNHQLRVDGCEVRRTGKVVRLENSWLKVVAVAEKAITGLRCAALRNEVPSVPFNPLCTGPNGNAGLDCDSLPQAPVQWWRRTRLRKAHLRLTVSVRGHISGTFAASTWQGQEVLVHFSLCRKRNDDSGRPSQTCNEKRARNAATDISPFLATVSHFACMGGS